jgi:hypothetical protein
MQINIYAGGKSWLVDENILVNWLSRNAVQVGAPNTVVREVVDDQETGRVLLNESK